MSGPRPAKSSPYPVILRDGAVAEAWVEAEEGRARLTARRRHGAAEGRRSVVDELGEALILADDEGRYVDANAAAAELTGYSLRELLTKSLADVTPGARQEDARRLWKAFRAAGAQSGRFTLRTATGGEREAYYQAWTDVIPGFHLSILRPL